MSVFIRPFKKEDLEAFEPIEQITSEFSPEFAQAIEDSGLSVTGIRDGKIIGCGGVQPVNEEQGEIWLRLSEDCKKHKLDTIRWLRDGFKIIEGTFGFKQINATIKCGFEQSIKLAKLVGFVQTQTRTYEGQKWLIFSKLVKE
jgi:RimJ/RimL family protein N-acetyltransferase